MRGSAIGLSLLIEAEFEDEVLVWLPLMLLFMTPQSVEPFSSGIRWSPNRLGPKELLRRPWTLGKFVSDVDDVLVVDTAAGSRDLEVALELFEVTSGDVLLIKVEVCC